MTVSIDQVRRHIEDEFSDPDQDRFVWVREMFTDRAILEPGDGTLQEIPWSVTDDDEIELGEPREVTLEYVAKAEGGPRLAGPIVRKDETKRLVYGAVLVPGEPDSDDEILSAEKVEEVAHAYLESFRAVDVQHDVERIDASPVESHVLKSDEVVEIGGEKVILPAGTWEMAVKVHEEDAWAEIVAGKRTGFSIMGVPEDQAEAALAAGKAGKFHMVQPALKRVTLADVGDGDANGPWVAPFVSLVDEPAVPKAKFYAIKQQQTSPDQPGWFKRWLSNWGGRQSTAEKATEVEDMKVDEVKTLVSDTVAAAVPEAVKSAVGEAMDEKLAPVTERLDKIESTSGGEAGESGDKGGDTGSTGAAAGKSTEGEEDIPPAVKAKIDELTGTVTKVTEGLEKLAGKTRATSRQPDDDPDGEPNKATKSLADDYDGYGRRKK